MSILCFCNAVVITQRKVKLKSKSFNPLSDYEPGYMDNVSIALHTELYRNIKIKLQLIDCFE